MKNLFRLRGDCKAVDVAKEVSFGHRARDANLQLLNVGYDTSLIHVNCNRNLLGKIRNNSKLWLISCKLYIICDSSQTDLSHITRHNAKNACVKRM
jgi:hypothetical protein